MKNLPNDNTNKFVAVLHQKIETGKLMNALAHMAAGLASGSGKANEMRFLQYIDKDGGLHPNISHLPFIILESDSSNKIRTVRNQAIAIGIPFTDFTSSMAVGTPQEQLDRTNDTSEIDLDYFGICLFGPVDILSELTGKLSLFH